VLGEYCHLYLLFMRLSFFIQFYMKTGQCKFGEICKFHHPLDRAAVGSNGRKQTVKLTLAGLPRREVF
jgi:Zinc finger C-x8-C-x5-C-x3-H type (and similar)